jgi:hypothetical protein
MDILSECDLTEVGVAGETESQSTFLVISWNLAAGIHMAPSGDGGNSAGQQRSESTKRLARWPTMFATGLQQGSTN